MSDITIEKAEEIGEDLGIDWDDCKFSPSDLLAGMKVELEHKDLTGGDLKKTAQIAIAHLNETSDYYKKLKQVEKSFVIWSVDLVKSVFGKK